MNDHAPSAGNPIRLCNMAGPSQGPDYCGATYTATTGYSTLANAQLASCATGRTASAGPPSPSPSFVMTPDPGQPCPGTPPSVVADTQLAGSDQHLVPFTPTGALVCRYGSSAAQQHDQLFATRALGSKQAASLADRINNAVMPAAKPGPNGTVHCPMDTGELAEVFAWNQSKAIQVEIHMGGCRTADNGSLQHVHISGELASRIQMLVPASATPSSSPPQ